MPAAWEYWVPGWGAGLVAGNIAQQLQGKDANWVDGMHDSDNRAKDGVLQNVSTQNPVSKSQNKHDSLGQGNASGQNWYANSGVNSIGNGGTAKPAIDQNVVKQYQQGIDTIEGGIDRLGGQLKNSFGNIQDQYNTNRNELDSARKNAENNYNTSTTANQQSHVTNRNNVLDSSSQSIKSLMRTLGMYGAGGSSERMVGSQAVADNAARETAGAGQVYSQNQRNLDTNWGQFKSEDENSRRKLDDWQTRERQDTEAKSKTIKQDLLTKLAEAKRSLENYRGGNGSAAAEEYLKQAAGLNKDIDALGRYKTTYNGKTPIYQQKALDSYQVGDAPEINTGMENGQEYIDPLQALYGVQEDEDQKHLLV